jgi:hypothetical protein
MDHAPDAPAPQGLAPAVPERYTIALERPEPSAPWQATLLADEGHGAQHFGSIAALIGFIARLEPPPRSGGLR